MLNIESSSQLEENYPIHAYLSYRCKKVRDIDARVKLKDALFSAAKITLRDDESETEEGDSLIEFMEDLTSARCVFLFLSPEYFQSAYTLFELIKINEQADLDKRFIIPLRLSEAMVTYEWTTSKNYFDNNEAVRNELVRLLKKSNVNQDNLWQRINAAWEEVIFPHLDILNVSLENAGAEEALGNLLGKTQAAITDAINNSTKDFQSELIKKITVILNRDHINANDRFKEELGLTATKDVRDIATHLVEIEAGKAITILTRVLIEKKALLESAQWKSCFYDAEKLCGWLLLNSVDHIWWFHNAIKLEKTVKTSLSNRVDLQDKKYMEVVISRTLFKAAHYSLYPDGQPKPAGKEYNVMCFDGFSAKAKKEELLICLYEDLYHNSPSSKTSQTEILTNIINRAIANHNVTGKPVYYLVSVDYLVMWESMAEEDSEIKKLTGYLQFICCENSAKPNQGKANKDQSLLLNEVALLLSLEHQETNHVKNTQT